ncbi:hypothetical protein B296_00048431 [Ensete ventricosum]|uniref:Uncharacterized protein n=1 Tax=Ensete ventricosum TaxID=4639 RepID=A0A426XXC8_ENSVE|nr:hypothetical protein B296_00048431 [Ensete ventricosum]
MEHISRSFSTSTPEYSRSHEHQEQEEAAMIRTSKKPNSMLKDERYHAPVSAVISGTSSCAMAGLVPARCRYHPTLRIPHIYFPCASQASATF